MGLRFAVILVLISALCLFSAPIYEATSWKGAVPEEIRERSSLIPLDRAVTDTLEGANWYHAVKLGANQRLRVDLSSSAFDPYLALFRIAADTLDMIESDDDDGEGNNARIERCIDAAGTYLLRVTAFGSTNSGSGRYEIRAGAENADCEEIIRAEREREQQEAAQREMEENRRREEARTLYRQGRTVSIGQTVDGNLGMSSTRSPDGKPFESWELTCRAGQSFQMDVEGQGFDAYARIYNGEGVELASNDDGGGNFNAQILHTCAGDGPIYLVATSFSNSASGRYVMRVSRR